MRVISRKCNIGLNGERYVKDTPFEVDDETGNRLLKQGTVELVDISKVLVATKVEVHSPISKTEVKPEKSEKPEPPPEEEFKKIGGRWRKK